MLAADEVGVRWQSGAELRLNIASPPMCDKVPTRLRGNTVSTLRQWSVEALDGLVWPKYSAAIHALVRIRAASEG